MANNYKYEQIDIDIAWEYVSAATDVLHIHGVGGISLSEVKGRGNIPHEGNDQ
jgi:hypothetical protein